MPWISKHKFLLLLLSVILFLVVHPLVFGSEAAHLLYDVLLTVFFLFALYIVFNERGWLVPGLVLGLPTLIGTWTGYAFPGLPRLTVLVAFNVAAAVFMSLTIAVILRGIYVSDSVTTDSVCGAFCGYLLLGLVFAHICCIADAVLPNAFHGSQELVPEFGNEMRRQSLLTYYSFVTLTTLGFGDITPANSLTRKLAWLEAALGQFYTAAIMAELIGLKVSQAIMARKSGAGKE